MILFSPDKKILGKLENQVIKPGIYESIEDEYR